MKYEDWMRSTSEFALKKLLRTVDRIVEDSSGEKLTSTDIDNLKDCFNTISMIHYLLDDHSHNHVQQCSHGEAVQEEQMINGKQNGLSNIDENMTTKLALR